MKGSDRPPLRHKKGIQVVQASSPHHKISGRLRASGSGSVESLTRSRGISISRETGITMDRIYDFKHFLPPKSPKPDIRRSDCD